MSLPATPAERSRAHFAHGAIHIRRRFKEGERSHQYINTWVHGYLLTDDLVHTSSIYKKMK